jgi:aryl-alcohol dehydrogenase-like predicted oxidoreductase
MPQDFSPQHIRASIEQSLRRLQTDYVDVYQLHSPDLAAIDMDAAVAALEQLRRNGKVRAYGISARSPADALKVVEEYDFATVQVNFNLIDHRASESGLFHLAKSRHFGIIARTPLCFGYLTGRLSGGENFDPSDHRNNWPAEQLQRWADAPRAFGKLYNGSRSATQLALLFCLAFDPVSTVIHGMMRPDEVDENVGVSALGPLTINELAEIRRIYQERAYYDPMVKQRALAESVVTA